MEVEQSDYEQWLASGVTRAFFKRLREDRQDLLEVLATTEDEKESTKLKGEACRLAMVLDFNRGEANVGLEAVRQ